MDLTGLDDEDISRVPVEGFPVYCPYTLALLHFGLPALPEWADWFLAELHSRKRIQPMMGFGYKGIAVKTNRQEPLKLIDKGLRNQELVFPTRNGAAGQTIQQFGRDTAG